MKIKGLLIIVICMIGLLGCTSKGFDIERVYRFVEIQSSNGKEIGTIVNSDDLEFFFEEMKFQEWKDVYKRQGHDLFFKENKKRTELKSCR